MQRNKDAKSFERKSQFNNNRDSYVDDSGSYVYTHWVKRDNGKWEREVLATIPFTEENREIILLLDQDDHDCDLQDRYEEEHADYGFRNQQEKSHGNPEEEDSFDSDPIENIADPNSDIFSVLYPEDKPVDPKQEEMEVFIHSELSDEQQDLFYGHMGEGKYLEDIRREEEAVTGKRVTKQAVHNRWDRIIAKTCKHFDVEKPKQEHKKKDQ